VHPSADELLGEKVYRSLLDIPVPVDLVDVAVVPEALLHPLLDSAGDVLRGLAPDEVPVVLRAITGFDRRAHIV